MKSIETVQARAVVMYIFVSPSQRLVRWNYASIKAAKKVWHPTRLVNAANTKLQPWTGQMDWRWHAEGSRPVYSVKPVQSPILRYVGGAEVPSRDIVAPTPRKRRRRKYKDYKPSARTVGRRLRQQQRLEDADPGVRPSQRVQRDYYEDSWGVRHSETSWKSYRKTQWRA